MRRTALRLIAASSAGFALLLAAAQLHSARRPRYGGTLRVEMQAAVSSLDPAESAASVPKEKLMALVFDTLTRLDDSGRPQPALAASWEHDSTNQHWEFYIHQNVKLHDESSLTQAMFAQILA